MSVSADSRHLDLSMSQIERLCPVAKALSSPVRVRMLELLCTRSMNVNEMAEALNLPVSTAALNIRQLEESGLITTAIQPGIRGAMKLCSQRIDSVSMQLVPELDDTDNSLTLQLPIGGYSIAESILPGCGAVTEHAWIGENDLPHVFYHAERFRAQLLWFASGALEYRFSLGGVDPSQMAWLEFSMELSSSAPLYCDEFKSDIFLAVNDHELGIWTSPCDYGDRRGRLNPSWWNDASSQYGQLKTWRVDANGSYLDGERLSDTSLADLHLEEGDYVSLRIGVHADAEHVGGMNLFGERFGDHAQGIVMRAGYSK